MVDALQLQEKIQSLLTKARLTSIYDNKTSMTLNSCSPNENDLIEEIEIQDVISYYEEKKTNLQDSSSSSSLFYNNWTD